MRVSDILRAKPSRLVSIMPEATLLEATRLLTAEKIGMLLVIEADGRLAGLLSERDVVTFLAACGSQAVMRDVRSAMARSCPVATPEESVSHVMKVMTARHARHLPVIDGGKLVGIVSIGDILKSRISEQDLESSVLRDIARMSIALAA